MLRFIRCIFVTFVIIVRYINICFLLLSIDHGFSCVLQNIKIDPLHVYFKICT